MTITGWGRAEASATPAGSLCSRIIKRSELARRGCARVLTNPLSPPLRGNAESSIHHFHEVSLLAEDEALALRHGEILARFRIGFQAILVGLVSRQAVERNQAPTDIVRA